MDNRIHIKDQYFSTRLPYADIKIREIYYSVANTTYTSSKDTINKLQQLNSKTKLNLYKSIIS